MGRYTCAYNCEHASDSDVKFPLYNPRKLKKWLTNMKLKDWTPSRFSVLCIDHFEEQYIDKTGKSVKLREDAVPTVFSSTPGDPQKRNTKPLRRQMLQGIDPRSGASHSLYFPFVSLKCVERVCFRDPKKPEKWRIITDAGLMKISSFPYFFHGDYCLRANRQGLLLRRPDGGAPCWQVTAPWQWLGLDVRGPLPQTLNGHRYVLSVTDYFSKWVEAVPVESCLPSCVAKHVADVIAHFGFPLRILSRLPHDIIQKINKELKEELKITIALVVHHQQTGSADLITQQLIDRMVNDLIEEHVADWDIYLPAKVFALCFKEHPKSMKRPFSLLCCAGLEPVRGPRGLDTVLYHSLCGVVPIVHLFQGPGVCFCH
uniref:THAP-type domain-containing protein n=1 Tax=Takifugu rubripes TaxID=31033 RepID=H2T568_TAKRU